MKIIGGSFGLSGEAQVIEPGPLLRIKGARSETLRPPDIATVAARQEKVRKFGVIGFIVGALMLSAILVFLFGPVGVVVGVAISAAGSFYSRKRFFADVRTLSGDTLVVEGSRQEVELLVAFGSRRTSP